MSFLQRELYRLERLLSKTPQDSPAHEPLYAAQQALAWASDPTCYASPSVLMHRYYGVGDGEADGLPPSNAEPVRHLPDDSHANGRRRAACDEVSIAADR